MRLASFALPLAMIACGGPFADVDADLDDADFSGNLTVYHGGRHILIIDRPYACRDIGWVRQNYFSAARPAESRLPFAAIQLTFDGDQGTINLGTFSLEGQGAPATGWLLLNQTPPATGDLPPVDASRARTNSQLQITRVTDNRVEGSFEAFFRSGDVTGSFRSEPCRNLRQ